MTQNHSWEINSGSKLLWTREGWWSWRFFCFWQGKGIVLVN